MDKVSWIHQSLGRDFVSHYLVMAWLIWKRRNVLVHGGRVDDREDLWLKAELYLTEISEACSRGRNQTTAARRSPVRKAPRQGCFEANVDAALDVERGTYNVGIVIRIAASSPCVVALKSFFGLASVEVAEVCAVFEGIRMAVAHNFLPLIVESDSNNVVRMCFGSLTSRLEVDNAACLEY